jgi:carbamoyltransferase
VIARAVPYIDKSYYNQRRRLTPKPMFERFRRLYIKYWLGERGSNFVVKSMAEQQIKKRLNKLGFKDYKFVLVDHHAAHAASAAMTSGFDKSLCITLDGVGDGLSGTVNIFQDGKIERISQISGRDSLGIMYEHVTHLLGMRELEDEGKTMCIADYSFPVADEKNKMLDFFRVEGLDIIAKHSTIKRFGELEKIMWNTRREQFAYMAQRTVEKHMLQLFKNAIEQTGIKDVCWAGGIASNIKANRILRLHSGMKRWFVFPHMGDGGLAAGAALYADNMLNGSRGSKLENAYLGPEYSDEEIKEEIKKHDVKFEQRSDVAKLAGELVAKGEFLFWFQGRMEYGPRALGNRSIVASAFSLELKNRLNMQVKKREWFQPFCPSLLEEDAKKIFEDYDGMPDRLMTMGYMTFPKIRDRVVSVIHVDGSSRPQMVGSENKKYREMIERVKRVIGDGIVLNTSFNIHGEPIVCSPKDAIETMIATKTKHMVMGDYLVELKT